MSQAASRLCWCVLLGVAGPAWAAATATGAASPPGSSPAGESLQWHDAALLTIEGRGWERTAGTWSRLPDHARGLVREEIWRLADDAAGLCVRFVTDSRRIAARWTLARPGFAMDHMAATAVGGLDLYGRTRDGWRWAGLGRLRSPEQPEAVLAAGLSGEPREYMLYLPLYNGVRGLSIGLDPGATLRPGPPRPAERARPIVVYGTSIVQGACASRPGMACPAILGRSLDRPAVNLGFSGNARMEPELADLLGEIDAAVYVLDALPNMTAAMVRERAGAFIGRLAQRRPGVPIVLVEDAGCLGAAFGVAGRDPAAEKNAALQAAYRQLRARVAGELAYVEARSLLGEDGEAGVDGRHLSDVGFMRMAGTLAGILGPMLDRQEGVHGRAPAGYEPPATRPRRKPKGSGAAAASRKSSSDAGQLPPVSSCAPANASRSVP